MMKIAQAAWFSGISSVLAVVYTFMWLGPGLDLALSTPLRSAWLSNHTTIWSVGWWLWLLVIFAWMTLLVTLMWAYLPMHRLGTMLQSGLLIIAAVLAIGGVIVWMNVLGAALTQDGTGHMTSLVDAFALGLVGAGCFMGGAVTAWIAIDLSRLTPLPWYGSVPGIFAGLAIAPAPFLLPSFTLLFPGLVLWLLWCLMLAVRRLPKLYPELSSAFR